MRVVSVGLGSLWLCRPGAIPGCVGSRMVLDLVAVLVCGVMIDAETLWSSWTENLLSG